MEAVLSALLRISRRRTDVDQRPPTRVDVGALTSRAVKRHEASLAQRRISVMDRVGGSIVVMGDAAALGTIVSNLIDNAAEYTPEGGELSVTAELVDGTLRFDVANGPVTLTADEVERMFEPFWRRDPTRGDGEHSGLGLAIVRAMCESLDGEVIGSLEEGGRLRMRVVVGVGSVE
jgi:signal transduction histidine kinase